MYTLTQNKKTLSTDDDASRSKKVITLMNRLGLSISYDKMMRIDTRLAERVIQEAGEFKVTVGRSIEPGIILHGAIDSFEHDKETLSGKDSSHDTILMVF